MKKMFLSVLLMAVTILPALPVFAQTYYDINHEQSVNTGTVSAGDIPLTINAADLPQVTPPPVMFQPSALNNIRLEKRDKIDMMIREYESNGGVFTDEMKFFIQKAIDDGHLPTANILQRFPDEMRKKIIEAIELGLREKNGENKEDTKKSTGTGLQKFFSEYMVQFLALVVSLVGILLAISGFTVAGSKRKKHVSKFINEIDDAYSSFRSKTKRCEAELYRLEDVVEERLKEGKIDEQMYELLMKRINKYMREIQEVDGIPEADKK